MRVAVVGAGPAGMYAVEELLERFGEEIAIDVIERLPVPWGLVRSGVAPDHPHKKLIIDRHFDFLIRDPRVRFFGNVVVGQDLHPAELADWYGAVIYAFGADGDVKMGIPGEHLPGCLSAREFISSYNGSVDVAPIDIHLGGKRAVIIGNGNVALDVARILTLPIDLLERTDIADSALDALRSRHIREVVILGRRDHWCAAYHNPELEEFEHLDHVKIGISGVDLSQTHSLADQVALRKVATLRRLISLDRSSATCRIEFRFMTAPVEVVGETRVEGLRVARMERINEHEALGNFVKTDDQSIIKTGLVLRAIGYKVQEFKGLPYDPERGIIPNERGRIATLPGSPPAYVTGWAKRGCHGIIGTNRKCAQETIRTLLSDLNSGILAPSRRCTADPAGLIAARKPQFVDLAGWQRIDRKERENGRMCGRPRIKIASRELMIEVAGGLSEG